MTIIIISSIIFSALIGRYWYGPLFGTRWFALMGYDQTAAKQSTMYVAYAVSALATATMAYILYAVIGIGSPMITLGGALRMTLALWLGFTLTVMAVNNAYTKRNATLLAIDAGYQLCVALGITLIIRLVS